MQESQEGKGGPPYRKDDSASEGRRRKLLAELRMKLKRATYADETSDEETGHDPQKKSRVMKGNKLAMKQNRTIELGWLHEGQQVKKQTGGGSRKISISKDANASAIIEQASNLFFPDGESKRGIKLEDVDLRLCDFSLNETPAAQTVGETYEKEKPSGILRWYLSSSWKDPPGETSKTQLRPSLSRKLAPVLPASHPQPSTFQPQQSTSQKNDITAAPADKQAPMAAVPGPHEHIEPTTSQSKQSRSHPQPNTSHPQPVTFQPQQSTSQKNKTTATPTVERSPLAAVPGPDVCIDGLYPVRNGEVDMSREPLDVMYFKKVESAYSGKTSMVTVFSRSQCLYTSTDEDSNPREPDASCDPLQNGYSVGGIAKGDKSFVQLDIESADDDECPNRYDFPSLAKAENPDPYLILHHPDEVWGFEEGKLVLAVVSRHHNNAGVTYEWFCDDRAVYSAGCVFVVDKPGHYNCVLKAVIQQDDAPPQEVRSSSNAIQVIKISANSSIVPEKKPHDCSPEQIEPSDISCNFTDAINHGSFGEIFKGYYKEEPVAVKRVLMKRGKRPDKLIMNEASIHQQITHKNIVRFIGTYMNSSHVFIVTEFIDGQNMEDMIYSQDEQVDMPHKKISVAVGVLEGVAYLHEHDPQIIHQDIKPANILLDEELSPKLCDLGLAKAKSFGVASTTSGLYAAGTPEYMSPERLLNNQKGTAASDIWALGLTLVEWFAGVDPWKLQDQDDEPVTYIRHLMRREELPPVLETSNLPLLVPCINYVTANRPTARHVLKQFQCPSCSRTMLP